MEAARRLSGYSLGEADLLRRAMGKKIRSEMDAQRKRFVEGAVKDGVEKGQAEAIFELLARFADYGFNKSHAAAYALVAYQTAYMKANYPVEFMAASMTYDMANTDKLGGIPRRGAAPRRQGRAAFDQSVGRRVRRRGQTRSTTRSPRSKAWGGRRSRRSSRRAARDRSATSRTSRAGSIRARSTSACWKASPPPAPSTRWRATARASMRRSTRSSRRRSAARGRRDRPERTVRRGRDARAGAAAGGRAVAAGRAAAARVRRDRLLPLRPSARRLRGDAQAVERAAWTAFATR